MRILYVTSSGAPTGLYGGSIALLNLIKGNIQYSNNIVGAVFPDKGVLSTELERLGIRCYYTYRYTLTTKPSLNNLGSVAEAPLRFGMMLYRRYRAMNDLRNIIDDFKPQIIHTNVGPLDIANKLAQEKQIPHVWHIREYQDLDFKMRFFPSKKQFYKNIHHQNNHLIAITQGVFDHFKMKESDRVIYDGVFDKKSDNILSQKKDYYLFVGSIKEAKGVEFLIRAYAEYIKNGGSYKLFIVGEGGPQTYKDKCVKLIKENKLKDKVIFLGYRTNVYQLMQEAVAIVVPSQFEGFGFITAEAMYNNCLVIGRNTGGTKEQLDNGFNLFNREIGLRFHTEQELTKHLCEINKNGLLYYKTIMQDAFLTASELYNNQRHIKEVLNYYTEILDL